MAPITTSFDTFVTREPSLAEVLYGASSDDEIYKSCVDLKDSSISKYPDKIVTHDVAGLGPMYSRGETTPFAFDTPGPAGTKETVYTNMALGVEFTENLIDDCMYGIIEDVIADLGNSYNLTRNIQTGAIYDDAFTGSIVTGPDGKALLATDHTAYMGGPARKNCPTVAQQLSYQGVQTVLTLMRRQINDRGNPKPALKNGQTIDVIIPPEMEFAADKIFDSGSAYDPTNNHNAINVLRKFRWNPVVQPYFTSTANWFLANPESKGIWLVDRQDLTRAFKETETHGVKYTVRARWGVHARTWEHLYGSNG